jgi:hypothetical protein
VSGHFRSCRITLSQQLDHVARSARMGIRRIAGGSCLCCPPGEVDDLLIGEVGGLDPPGNAIFCAEPRHNTSLRVDLGGRVALVGPAVPEDGVRASLGGAPEGPPAAE